MAYLLGLNVRSFLILGLLDMKTISMGLLGPLISVFVLLFFEGLIALRLGAEAMRCAQSK